MGASVYNSISDDVMEAAKVDGALPNELIETAMIDRCKEIRLLKEQKRGKLCRSS